MNMATASNMSKRQVGIVGFGHLGQYLYQAIKDSADQEVAFVWNRTSLTTHETVEGHHILEDLSLFADRKPDLIVEVAHPIISSQYGEAFLAVADYMVGSPTALANQEVEDKLRKAAKHHGLYIPSGALWGSSDIQKMADRGTLQALTVTMKKHPNSFKLNSPLKDKNDAVTDCETVLYEGPVRSLCPLAPNNVNTMAAAAMAAHNLGFDKVQGRLLADPSLTDWHVVEVDVTGPGDVAAGSAFTVSTVRKNPAKVGKVTGSATYASFLSSVLREFIAEPMDGVLECTYADTGVCLRVFIAEPRLGRELSLSGLFASCCTHLLARVRHRWPAKKF